jgi:hypothetical protein
MIMKLGKPAGSFPTIFLAMLLVTVWCGSALAQFPRPKGERIITVWNRGGCSFTQTSRFTLNKYRVITGLITWRKWAPGENEVTGWLYRDGKKVIGAIFSKGDCDGNQRSWCEGVWRVPGIHGHPGNYVLKVEAGRICQNATSKGNGYIQVYAKSGQAPAPAASSGAPAKGKSATYVYNDGSGKPGRDIVIHKQGNVITGAYHGGKSVFAGTLKGNVIRGRFGYHRKQPTTGNFIWVLSKDGKSFTAKYCNGKNCTPNSKWGTGVYTLR